MTRDAGLVVLLDKSMACAPIMIMAGGTGGHVFPALAVAEYLPRGAGASSGWAPRPAWRRRWCRSTAMTWLGALLRAARQGLAARACVAVESADRVLAERARDSSAIVPTWCSAWAVTSAFPGGMMASLLCRPLVIHEQNSVAGLRNQGARARRRPGAERLSGVLAKARGAAIRCARKSPRCLRRASAMPRAPVR